MSKREEPGHETQGFATTRHSRADCSDWQICDRCWFFVSHPLQSDEQNYRPLFVGQLSKSSLQIAKLEPPSLRWRERRAQVTSLRLDARALARVTASEAYMLVVQYGEEPGAKVGSFGPQMDFPERTGEAILDEIVCSDRIARQDPRVISETRDQGLDLPVNVFVDRILVRRT
jgi:hypothetical protein